jgi:predicted nucleic acid-binding protein
MSLIYLDTSVLAKRYLRSDESDALDTLLEDATHRFLVSDLCVVELESVVARRARETPGIDRAATRLRIDDDMRSGFFLVRTLDTSILIAARRWIAEGEPLATLDALHLASALDAEAEILATDDKQLARAARSAGLQVTSFL